MEDGSNGTGKEGTGEKVGGCYVWGCFVSGISLSLRSKVGWFNLEGRGLISDVETALEGKDRVAVVGRWFVFLVVLVE